MKRPLLKYLFYATLLDAYQDYLYSDRIYSEYWGFSENPPMTEDEFHEKQRLSLLDRINRVPFDSEKADRGTAFNEIVDCLILNRKSEKMQVESIKTPSVNPDTKETEWRTTAIKATLNGRTFTFPVSICREFSDYYKGALPQVYTEAILPTVYGDVLLYGYLDELMPVSIHDIKTTTRYTAGKFRNHWQHIVYPYCLNKNGNEIQDFEYNILLINEKKGGVTYETFTEHYSYLAGRDIPLLTKHVEDLIEFIDAHRDTITDLKIFNKHEG
ncbi:MAG: HNH endonuclease [Dysgonamonadaceae bacterium]|jgi:hypothetical protein|nr:HNH endonuclease [Dysgonamonadaceae bacterium]